MRSSGYTTGGEVLLIPAGLTEPGTRVLWADEVSPQYNCPVNGWTPGFFACMLADAGRHFNRSGSGQPGYVRKPCFFYWPVVAKAFVKIFFF